MYHAEDEIGEDSRMNIDTERSVPNATQNDPRNHAQTTAQDDSQKSPWSNSIRDLGATDLASKTKAWDTKLGSPVGKFSR